MWLTLVPSPSWGMQVIATERLRRRIEQLLDEAEEAISQHHWEVVRGHAHSVLALDPENPDGLALLEAAKRAADNVEFSVANPPDCVERWLPQPHPKAVQFVGGGALWP